MERKWEIRSSDPDRAHHLAQSLSISSLVASILVGRGIIEPEEADRFLHPSFALMRPPTDMKDMEEAADEIAGAIRDNKHILIYGDYDVDGVTSVSLFKVFMDAIGANISYYIPSRIDEGYGLNPDSVRRIAERNVDLLVTTDCGISDHREVEMAIDSGMKVIVTDHHEASATLPGASAVLNPHRADCAFPFKDLAGVGIIFYLLVHLRTVLDREGIVPRSRTLDLRECLDLVALGTVSDICPLLDENRLFVRNGLDLLTREKRTGIKALKEVSGLATKEVNAWNVGFQLGPRINAVGRLGKADMGVKLLTTSSLAEALKTARAMDIANLKRQQIGNDMVEDARAMILADRRFENKRSIVLASERWHPGIVGIVASRLVNEFYKPTILIALKQGRGRGSARSIPGFNIYEGIRRCGSHLLGFGGHKNAAGVTIDAACLDDFVREFEQAVSDELDEDDFVPRIAVDAELGLDKINLELVDSLQELKPFGMANPEPIFATHDVKVHSKQTMAMRHLKMVLESEGNSAEAIWFNHPGREIRVGQRVSVVYQPRIDTFTGKRKVVLHIKDLKKA